MERSILIDKLSADVDLFCARIKLAGLLKVPETLLSQANTWLDGAYCGKLKVLMDDNLNDKSLDRAFYQRRYDSLKLFIDAINTPSDSAEEKIAELMSIGNSPIAIPVIVDSKRGPQLERSDGLNNNGIWFERTSPGKFFFEIGILCLGETLNGNKEGTAEQVLKFLVDKVGELSHVRTVFYQALKNFRGVSFSLEVQELINSLGDPDADDIELFTFDPSLLDIENKKGVASIKVSLELEMASEIESYLGVWLSNVQDTGYLGRMRVVGLSTIPDTEEEFRERLRRMHRTVRHEAQHAMQDAIKLLTGSSRLGGLPGNSIEDNTYNHSGNSHPIDRSKYKPKKREHNLPRLDHALQRVEFAPRLSDSIDEYRHISKAYPKELRRDLASVFVGETDSSYFHSVVKDWNRDSEDKAPNDKLVPTDNFFSSLRNNQPEKYRKALKDFYVETFGKE